MEHVKKHLAMKTPPIVSTQEWEAARQQLLVKEKALTRARDALAAEEDEARALLDSLSDAQRRDAVFDDRTYGDIVTTNAEKVDPLAPVGIPAAKLGASQRAQLVRVIEVYARAFEPLLAEARMARVRDGGVENIRFGWAGATARGGQHYYRVQGPRFLIEYDATQDRGNHVHTVWRDFDGDFGRDLLKEHYQDAAGTVHRH